MRTHLKLAALVAMLLGATLAHAGTFEDCNQKENVPLREKSCKEVIELANAAMEQAAVAHVRLCKVYADLSDLPHSKQHCTQAINLTPYAENYLTLGSAEFENGLYEESLTHFERALQLNPVLSEAKYNRDVALEKLSKIQQEVAIATPKP